MYIGPTAIRAYLLSNIPTCRSLAPHVVLEEAGGPTSSAVQSATIPASILLRSLCASFTWSRNGLLSKYDYTR